MKINIYTISKDTNSQLDLYIKNSRRFGVEIQMSNIFNNKISQAQKDGKDSARKSYTNAFEKYLNPQSILLSENGDELDSIGFSNFIEKNTLQIQFNEMRFFIAGAFGFERSLLSKYKSLSLGKMTFSHKIAELVLLDQIYRAFCIINNHPYHKGI